MRVLILGAGHTGYAVAQALVGESNDISVVDVDASRVSQLQRHFDLRGIVGDAASPAVLREAGIEDTDILIAVTASDETNLVASLLAAKLFNVPTRIARVRRNELSNYPALLGEEGFHITDTIWPEQALTDTLLRLIEFPEAHQVVDLASGQLTLLSLTVKEPSPLIGLERKLLLEKLTQANIVSVAAFRDSTLLDENTPLLAGDEVLALVSKDNVLEAISLIHPKEAKTKNLVIAGDANLALRVVTALKNQTRFNIKILEKDADTATDIARHLPERVLLVNGSNLQEEDLANVDIDTCDLFVSLSAKDDTNIMSALLAKRLGAKRVIALVDNQTFADLVRDTNIDIIISKTQVTLSELMQYVRRGDIAAVHELHHGKAELIEVIAHGSAGISRVIGKKITDIGLPNKVRLCGVIRDKVFLAPSENLTIASDDRLIVFLADKKLLPEVEALFAVDVGFF